MINDTKNFPLAWADRFPVYIGYWRYPAWATRENEIITWLEEYPSNCKFAWERPNATFYFSDEKIAVLFALRWSS